MVHIASAGEAHTKMQPRALIHEADNIFQFALDINLHLKMIENKAKLSLEIFESELSP